jgi:hypothetical protein
MVQLALQLASVRVRGLTGGWQHSDIKIINMACDVTALAAVKEAKRKSISKDGLFHIRTLTNLIREQCKELGCGIGAPQSLYLTSQHSGNPSCASFSPIDGWYSIALGTKQKEFDRLAGDSIDLSPQMPNDMTELTLKGNSVTFIEYVECLDRNVQRCEQLFHASESANTSTSMYQICTLIEHLFAYILPLPQSLPTHVVPPNWWCTGSLSLETQRKGLRSLTQLATHYTAASFLLDRQDRAVASSRSAVLSSILQSFDCLMRVLCEGEIISPLTLVIAERGISHSRPYKLSLSGFHNEVTLERAYGKMIFFKPHQLHLITSSLTYFTHGRNTNQGRSFDEVSLFDWSSDSERLITQFRVELADPMIDFVSRLFQMRNGKLSPDFKKRIQLTLNSKSIQKWMEKSPTEPTVFSNGTIPSSSPSSTNAVNSTNPKNAPAAPSLIPKLKDQNNPPSAPSIPPPPSPSYLKEGSEKCPPNILSAIRRCGGMPGRIPSNLTQTQKNEPHHLSEKDQLSVNEFVTKLKLFCANETEWEAHGCPEFVWLRTITFLVKFSLEPMDLLLSRNTFLTSKNLHPNSFIPMYHFSDPNITATKIGVHIAGQPKLGLASEHPKSPVDPERFVPPTMSGLPQKPHYLAMALAGISMTQSEVQKAMSRPKTTNIVEEDMQHMSNVSMFGDCLSKSEVIELGSLLTVPYMNIPLVLEFFTGTIGSLLSSDLRHILESVLFEPRQFNLNPEPITEIPILNETRDIHFGTSNGILIFELQKLPDPVLKPLLELIKTSVRLCVGDLQSSFANLFLFLTRITVRICHYRCWVERYCSNFVDSTIMIKLIEVLRDGVMQKLHHLLKIAISKDDMAGCVLIRSHLVLCTDLLMETKCEINHFHSLYNASYVITWHSKENYESQLTNLSIAPDAIGSEKEKIVEKRSGHVVQFRIHAELNSTPIFDVFLFIQKWREKSLGWWENLSEKEQNQNLDQMSTLLELSDRWIGEIENLKYWSQRYNQGEIRFFVYLLFFLSIYLSFSFHSFIHSFIHLYIHSFFHSFFL